MNELKIRQLVEKCNNVEATREAYLNLNENLSIELMKLCNIDTKDITILNIPLNSDKQIAIYYLKDNIEMTLFVATFENKIVVANETSEIFEEC